MSADASQLPVIGFGREICCDLDAALHREWLVTNGLGGYASGTVAGVNTRRYHGLLVAALTPCVGRTVMLGTLIERATYLGATYDLSTNEYTGGVIAPSGYGLMQAFELRGSLPVWVFALGDALLERRIWMVHGQNTTCVRYRLLRASGPVSLTLAPLVTYRAFHELTSGNGWAPDIETIAGGAEIHAYAGAVPYRIVADSGSFMPGGAWWWNFHYREEKARGLDDRSDLYAIGSFAGTLSTGRSFTLAATTETVAELDAPASLASAEARQVQLLHDAGAPESESAVRHLVLAADQFMVRRVIRSATPATADAAAGQHCAGVSPGISEAGRSVIAGYHWFNDWGRDTMIALPGLAIATGRAAEAAQILRTFARFVVDGLLPNNFPDDAGVVPGYNTVDATLWYVLAVRALYFDGNGPPDESLLDDLLPILRDIIEHHIAGTRFGIAMDPANALLSEGEPGLQLTWMDARFGEYVVTPRAGKPVEICALWYNALRTLAELLEVRKDPTAGRYAALADRAGASFRFRFVRTDSEHLKDVVDGPEGDDLSIRPNQVFAVSLPYPLLDDAQAAAVVRAVGRDLLTTYGLRSLAPSDPAYIGHYGGDQAQRDGAYHQGTAWTWLMGPFAEAHYRVHGDAATALAILRPFEHHLRDAGLGSISEIFDGDPPHLPGGCIAQAWSVAEVLRVWRLLERAASSSAGNDKPAY